MKAYSGSAHKHSIQKGPGSINTRGGRSLWGLLTLLIESGTFS